MTSATQTIGYERAPYGVRPAFGETHSLYWERLARAGAWWTGAERVAIAAEARAAWDCALCAEKKEALSPNAVAGDHDVAGDVLPAAAVEAVHRVVTDVTRLSKQWLEGLYKQGMTDGHYVELVGTVVCVVSIDSFCIGLGIDLNPLPEPVDGEVSRYRPANVEEDGAFVPMLPVDVTGTPEEDLWTDAMAPYVYRALSLVPDEVRSILSISDAHYLGGPFAETPPPESALARPQMELVASRVSALNECLY
jgi:hypothetical protein